jgi:hypothetical protein
MAVTITDEMREHLTPEELEGMTDGDFVDEGEGVEIDDDGNGAIAEQGNPDAQANSEPEADKAAGKPEEGKAVSAAGTAAAEAAAAAAEEAAAQKKPAERKPRPVFEAPEVPADVDDQIAAAKLAKLKLAEKFDEGEITAVEYAKQTEELNDFQRELEHNRFKAQLSAESQQSREMETWEDTCSTFLGTHPEISKSKLRYDSFDYAVRLVTGDQENASMTGAQMLEKAYQTWVTELGIQVDHPAQPGAKPDPQKAKVVPNIGSLPAAQANNTDDGKFAYLDRLADADPLKYEATLAKLSDADREAYLSM